MTTRGEPSAPFAPQHHPKIDPPPNTPTTHKNSHTSAPSHRTYVKLRYCTVFPRSKLPKLVGAGFSPFFSSLKTVRHLLPPQKNYPPPTTKLWQGASSPQTLRATAVVLDKPARYLWIACFPRHHFLLTNCCSHPSLTYGGWVQHIILLYPKNNENSPKMKMNHITQIIRRVTAGCRLRAEWRIQKCRPLQKKRHKHTHCLSHQHYK